MTTRILISGAGIAGLTTAYWLAQYDFEVVMVERAAQLRTGGQNIDISDAAIDIVAKMGLMEKIRENHTGEQGLQFVDKNNVAKGQFPVGQKGSLTKEIEILRGDLVETLKQAIPSHVTVLFDKTIALVHPLDDHVVVTFEDGKVEQYDILIAADGMNSSTRKLIFNDIYAQCYLGCWSSYFTVPRIETDNDWWRWYTSSTGVVAFLRPDNKGTMRASVNFLSEEGNPPRLSLREKKDRLRSRLANGGWECDRLAEALKDVDDVFLGPLHQIKADTWSKGRCVLSRRCSLLPYSLYRNGNYNGHYWRIHTEPRARFEKRLQKCVR